MPWIKDDSLESFLVERGLLPVRGNCPGCGVTPGETHKPNCDVERCSACGRQLFSCGCGEHDRCFARWTGFWPGTLESIALGFLARWEPSPDNPVPADVLCRGTSVDLNRIYTEGWHKSFFVKPGLADSGNEAVAGDSKSLTAEEILADPAASFWLKETLRSALSRDPVDAANEAVALARALDFRCRILLDDHSNGCNLGQ